MILTRRILEQGFARKCSALCTAHSSFFLLPPGLFSEASISQFLVLLQPLLYLQPLLVKMIGYVTFGKVRWKCPGCRHDGWAQVSTDFRVETVQFKTSLQPVNKVGEHHVLDCVYFFNKMLKKEGSQILTELSSIPAEYTTLNWGLCYL